MPHSARRPSTDRLDRAIAAHQAGLLNEAEAGYRALLTHDSRHADAQHLMGLLACDRGDPAVALPWLERAIALEASRPAFQNTYGRALAALGRPLRAEAAYRAAWALRPNSAEIANNLACLLRARGKPAEAIQWFWQAGALAPDNAVVAVNLAQTLAETGDHTASVMQFEHALLLNANEPDAQYGLGRAHLVLGQLASAEACLRRALDLRPNHADTLNNLGVALDRQGKTDAARHCFTQALRTDPNHADALSNLGCLLLHDNLQPEALAAQERALARAPLHSAALWARCFCELPILYGHEAEIAPRRQAYTVALDRLITLAKQPAARTALSRGLGSMQPFFLPYQGQCDKDLQQKFGALACSLINPDPAIRLATPPAPGARLRIAIVTGFAIEHTVWRLMVKAWLTYLDRARFRVSLFHTGPTQDSETAIARNLADSFSAGGNIRAAILAERPHVILYPEIGMDPTCLRLAAERLAPLQCVAWGHPQTTGLPTIDVFLSGAAMEPPNAQPHYTERLVRLPTLGVVPMPAPVTPAAVPGEAFGLRATATAFWCGQALYKYLPQHDTVFAAIAKHVPDSQFLFIAFAKSPTATAQFRARLKACFTRHGLDPAYHLIFADSMDQPTFLASAAACDIVLDSIGWSGGKSTLDLLALGPAIVTLEGDLMRARHTAAILRRLGSAETIADTPTRFIEIATALAHDPARRATLQSRLRQSSRWLFADLSPIRALEQFLLAPHGDSDALAPNPLRGNHPAADSRRPHPAPRPIPASPPPL